MCSLIGSHRNLYYSTTQPFNARIYVRKWRIYARVRSFAIASLCLLFDTLLTNDIISAYVYDENVLTFIQTLSEAKFISSDIVSCPTSSC